jgi:hypothetical protein
MAGLKKKKKEPTNNPNTVLVIFMVLFVLLTLGFAFWGYSGMAASAEAKNDKDKAVKDAGAKNTSSKFYSMLYNDLRLALGEKLDEKDEERWKVDREAFMKDDFGEFKNEPSKEEAKKFMQDFAAKFGVDEIGKYKSNLHVKLEEAETKLKDYEAKTNTAIAAQKKSEDLLRELQKKQDEFFTSANARIQKNNDQAMAAVKTNVDSFDKQAKLIRELNDQLKAKDEEVEKRKEELEKQLKIKDFVIRDLKKELVNAGSGGAGGGALIARPGADPFPLLLDINMNKPLWDAPVGKIARVDLTLRHVTINLGSAHGIKPEVTFNVFGPNSAGRAEKQMKASIEVIKVLDSATSLARITSLYDAEGNEILLNLDSRTKFQRENEIPLKEGDLLFNLFWGTRVAVVGYVSITGEPSPNNPAEQARQMDDFMYLLRRNGIQVDAYVDMRDGQIKGNLSPKTRYLIKGDDLKVAAAAPAGPAAEGDDKEKEPGKDAGAGDERNHAINKSNATLRKDAVEKGLLLISAENFANIIGYRRARNANSTEISGFRPMLPFAGSVESGVIVAPERPAVEEKK